MTSSWCDLLVEVHRLHYLPGPIIDASDDGGGHGGMAVLHSVCQSSPATAKPNKARNRTTTTVILCHNDLDGRRCSDEARPRQLPWRSSGEDKPTATQS